MANYLKMCIGLTIAAMVLKAKCVRSNLVRLGFPSLFLPCPVLSFSFTPSLLFAPSHPLLQNLARAVRSALSSPNGVRGPTAEPRQLIHFFVHF